jgi:hypothetical protein
MKNDLWKPMGLCLLFIFLFSSSPSFSQTKETESSHKDSAKQNHGTLKVEELPAPNPKVMETLQQIGNKAGKEFSKATGKAANAVNQAVRENKPSGNK